MCGTGGHVERCNQADNYPQQNKEYFSSSINFLNSETPPNYLPQIEAKTMNSPAPSFNKAASRLHLYAENDHHPQNHQGSTSLDSSPYSDLSSPPFSYHSDLHFANSHNSSSPQPHQLPAQTPSTSSMNKPSPSRSPTLSSQRNPFIGRSACVVCGDRARGCNFGAITCASCKEFFRRNAFKMTASKLKCYFQNKCDINIYSRRFCAACRLSKCYQMGMKSEYIMSDAEKYERHLKIMERKLTSQSRRIALNVPLEDSETTAAGEYNSTFFPTSQEIIDDHHHHNLPSSFQTIMNNGSKQYHQVKEEYSNQIIFSSSDHLSSSKNGTSFHPLENTPPTLNSSHNQHSNQLIRSESEYKFVSEASLSPTYSFAGSRQRTLDFGATSLSGGVASTSVSDVWFAGAPFLSPDRDAPFSWSSSMTHPQPPPPPGPPIFELDEPESVKKLLRKVKVIRESGFYPTKFQLLVRAHSAEKSLSLSERCCLKYLSSVVQIMQAEIITDLPINQKCLDLMRIAETVTFCFIKMCKKLNAFQALSPEDQVGLVKGRVVETLILWSMMTINLEKECWEALDLERNIKFSLKMELLKEANKKLYEEHRRYAMSFDPEWRFNDNLMSLLLVISLYDADKSELSNAQAIRKEKAVYCSLLKRYISTLYEDSQVEETYSRLLSQLKLTEAISESHVKAYFDVSPNEMNRNGFGGLIMEIFDLNS